MTSYVDFLNTSIFEKNLYVAKENGNNIEIHAGPIAEKNNYNTKNE